MDYFNSVRCFNPINKEWSEVAPMNARRYSSRGTCASVNTVLNTYYILVQYMCAIMAILVTFLTLQQLKKTA